MEEKTTKNSKGIQVVVKVDLDDLYEKVAKDKDIEGLIFTPEMEDKIKKAISEQTFKVDVSVSNST